MASTIKACHTCRYEATEKYIPRETNSCTHSTCYLVRSEVLLPGSLDRMAEASAPIKPLPVEVAARIQSSTAIPSLSSAILGLVANSLDAEACKIDIIVDFGRGMCVVEDDGYGIAPSEFGENGGLGKPYRKLQIILRTR